MREQRGMNNYKRPQMFADVYVGKEHLEFKGDLETSVKNICQKFGIVVTFEPGN